MERLMKLGGGTGGNRRANLWPPTAYIHLASDTHYVMSYEAW
jgi:hypothetical protein